MACHLFQGITHAHHDAQRSLALHPARHHAGTRRQNHAHPGREVLHPAALGERRRHALRRYPVGRRAQVGQRLRDVPQDATAALRPSGSWSSCCSIANSRAPSATASGWPTSPLHAITGTRPGGFSCASEQRLGMLRSELDYAEVEAILEAGLHEFFDALQVKMNTIDECILGDFFAQRPYSTQRRDLTESHDFLPGNYRGGRPRRDRRYARGGRQRMPGRQEDRQLPAARASRSS